MAATATAVDRDVDLDPAGPLTRNGRATGLVGRLNAEFARLRGAPGTAQAVAGWAATESELARCRSLVDVEAVVSAPTGDTALRALLVRAHAGDGLAGRVVMQACLGQVLGLARRAAHHYGGDVEESEAVAVARLWELVGSYSLGRGCQVRDGLCLDVLNTLTSRDGRSAASTALGHGMDLDRVDGVRRAAPAPEPPDPLNPVGRADEDVLRLLTWAVDRTVLTADEAGLLWRIHSPQDAGAARSDAARALRISEATLRQRASRARARLLAAVREATSG